MVNILKSRKLIMMLLASAILAGSFFYFRHQVYFSRGSSRETKILIIEKGKGNAAIASKLKKEGLIAGKIYFYYYLRSHGRFNKILPGEYEIPGNLTIPEIAVIVTSEQSRNIKITFPEGWTSAKMAERIAANGLDRNGFLNLVGSPNAFRDKYDFLEDKNIKTLEGYLFPDTYFFTKESTPEEVVKKMLGIFNTKVTPQIKSDAAKNGKTPNEIIIMASIIEGEVRTDEDRKTVSGIFWKRFSEGKTLQSCATLAYVTGENKKQYSEADTKIQSPYNTYLYRGLPPAPISNPGLSAITAAIYPAQTDYNYFLSDPETGKTIFSKTYEEHTTNKTRYGL